MGFEGPKMPTPEELAQKTIENKYKDSLENFESLNSSEKAIVEALASFHNTRSLIQNELSDTLRLSGNSKVDSGIDRLISEGDRSIIAALKLFLAANPEQFNDIDEVAEKFEKLAGDMGNYWMEKRIDRDTKNNKKGVMHIYNDTNDAVSKAAFKSGVTVVHHGLGEEFNEGSEM
jgi:hypothetical protein